MSRQQLPLPFPHEPLYDPRDFLTTASNQEAIAWLARMRDWPDRRLAIWGSAGCGKTHLLRTWSTRTGASCIDGRLLQDPGALPLGGLLAIDDADLVQPDEALLHVLNTVRDRGMTLLLAGREAPSRWMATLSDLSSRLRAIAAVEIQPPDDAMLRLLFAMLLSDRQLVVSESLQAWLLRRLPRSPGALRETVARLDRLSLATGGKVTRALASRLIPHTASWEGQEAFETKTDCCSETIRLL